MKQATMGDEQNEDSRTINWKINQKQVRTQTTTLTKIQQAALNWIFMRIRSIRKPCSEIWEICGSLILGDLHPSLALQPVPLLHQTQLKTEIDTGMKYAEDADCLEPVEPICFMLQSKFRPSILAKRPDLLAYKSSNGAPLHGRFFIDFLRCTVIFQENSLAEWGGTGCQLITWNDNQMFLWKLINCYLELVFITGFSHWWITGCTNHHR